MDNNKMIEEILKSKEFKSKLREFLARKISNEYHFHDVEGELIKREVRALIKEEAKTMIEEMIKNYYEMHNLKIQIENTLKSFGNYPLTTGKYLV